MMKSKNPIGLSTMSPAIKDADNYNRMQFKLAKPYLGDNILECGTGNGIMTELLDGEEVKNIYSIDIDPKCHERLKNKTFSKKFTFEQFDLNNSDFVDMFSLRQIDTILIFNVLEHLSDDVVVLNNLSSILNPDGRIIIFVPAFNSIYGGMDLSAGHYRRYCRKELKDKLSAAGLISEKMIYINPIGFVGWWLNNKVFKIKNLENKGLNKQILFFDKLLLPISNLLNKMTLKWFGLSIFAVCRKSN
jgi:SAM-dependent methyltransferase